jgi:hypothetical protein
MIYKFLPTFLVKWIFSIKREIAYRKRIKELRKRDPFIYK